jgi:hypothetical protein
MSSFSFKTFLKFVSKDDLQALASSTTYIEELCSKLNLNKAQVIYLYKKVGIALKIKKDKKTSFGKPLLLKEQIEHLVGKPLQVVCQELNLKPKKVITLFSQHGLPVPVRSNNFATKCPISKQELEHEYITLNKTTISLGEKYQVSKQQICNWLVFYQIPVRPKGFNSGLKRKVKRQKIWSWSNDEFLTKVKNYESAKDFCKKENVSYIIFNKFIKERNIETPFPKQKFEFTKEYLLDLYMVQNMSIKEIAEHEGCHWQTINRYFKEFGIKGRLGKRKKLSQNCN